MKRRAPWPLPKLLAANRNALTIYGTLRYLAGDWRKLSTTRARIGEVCGLYRDTITAALQALNAAGWVRVTYGRQGNRTWYRLTFPVAGFFPVSVKTRHSKRAATGKNPAQQTVCCTGKNPPHSLIGVGRAPAAALSALARAAAPALAPPEENQGPMLNLCDFLREKGLVK